MCIYSALLEPRARRTDSVFRKNEKLPVPFAVDAPWKWWSLGEELSFRVILLGKARSYRESIEKSLLFAFAKGAGKEGWRKGLVSNGWKNLEASSLVSDFRDDTKKGTKRCVQMRMMTPLRLVRKKRELRSFDFLSLVRDLSFRISVWGSLHQGQPWPPVWWFLFEEAKTVRVSRVDVRGITFARFSSRQKRVIPMQGLVGEVELENLTPSLFLLLRMGEVSGSGKGSSIGLGRIKACS
ncbi:MAG: CRISPR system precrRNA processing endoribonuclease RAMP protein Cas6 [Candidatus Glassbacteria bacterium]